MNLLPITGPMSSFVYCVPDEFAVEPACSGAGGSPHPTVYDLSPSTSYSMFRENGIDVNYVFPPDPESSLRSPISFSKAFSPDLSPLSDCFGPSPQAPLTPLIEITPYDSPVSLPPASPSAKSHKSSPSLSHNTQKSGIRKNRDGARKQKKQSKNLSPPEKIPYLSPSIPSPPPTRIEEIRPSTAEDQIVEDKLILHLKEGECLQWKDIAARFKKQFGKTLTIPALQMRYTRMRNRGRVWAELEDEVLQRATEEIMKNVWRDVSEYMVTLGLPDRIPADVCRARWRQMNKESSSDPFFAGSYQTESQDI